MFKETALLASLLCMYIINILELHRHSSLFIITGKIEENSHVVFKLLFSNSHSNSGRKRGRWSLIDVAKYGVVVRQEGYAEGSEGGH